MRSRFAALIVAVILGVLATAGVALYISYLTGTAKISGQKILVYTAKRSIPPGKSASELVDGGLIDRHEIPRRYAAADAITSLNQISGKTLTASLSKDEQLTEGNFKILSGTGELSLQLKKDQLAIAVPVDQFSGVAGQLSGGDRVIIVATFKGPGDNADFSRILLTNVPILSAPKEQKSGQTSAGATPGQLSLTVAVSPAEAEKLVFAAQTGKIWVALESARAKGKGIPPTNGVNQTTVFP